MNFDWLYLMLANSLAIFHGLIVLPIFILGPIFLYLNPKRLIWLEQIFLLSATIAIMGFIVTGECFLSRWEWSLRALVDSTASYEIGFINFWLAKIGIFWSDVWTLNIGMILIALGLGRIIFLKTQPIHERIN